MTANLDYGNWIRRRVLIVLAVLALATGALVFVPFGPIYRVLVGALFIVLLVSFAIPAYAYSMFSHRGGRFQEKVYATIADELGAGFAGHVLDIGSGNGVLAVTLALRAPGADVTGVDYWGKDWEYSRDACLRNAEAAGVADRTRFMKGDAAALEFDQGTFDAVVSNLTFHEVRSAPDKRMVVAEALRVLKPGGRFVFVDYFLEKRHYGPRDDFRRFLDGLGLATVALVPLGERMAVPVLLRHPKIFGRVAMVSGSR